MGRLFFITFFVGFYFTAALLMGQSHDFRKDEETLMGLAEVMVNAEQAESRKEAFSQFYPLFSQVLSQAGSYTYPFDSLIWISKKEPTDKAFRIFTGIIDQESSFVHYGFLQLPTGKVYPLHDRLEAADDWEFTITGDKDWMGALYYDIREDANKDGNHYLLFGLHKFIAGENAKMVEVLSFTKDGNPVFGKEIFKRDYPDARSIVKARLMIKYDASSFVSMHYNPELKYIVHDHLVPSITPMNGSGMSLVSDGSLIGYEKKGNYWNYIDKVYTQTLDEAPRPHPVLDKRSKDLFGKQKGGAGNKK